MIVGRAIDIRARAVAWVKADPPGAEFVEIQLESRRLRARGVAIGSDPEPYRLSFELQTREEYITDRAVVETQGAGWTRQLEIQRSPTGVWSASSQSAGKLEMPEPGGDPAELGEALDLDLGLSPVFNTMPVLRHDLHNGGSAEDFLMIWISVPDLSIHASPQRYTFLERRSREQRLVRFEAVGEGEDFVADVQFDSDGLVVDYPGIASRIRGRVSEIA
ncbi:MAG: putative glycolipid-binding domain-containing protein [Solirubrobacteraceae bacterium]